MPTNPQGGTSQQQAISVQVAATLPPPVLFDQSTGDWSAFRSRLINLFKVYPTTDQNTQKSYLLASLSDGTSKLLQSLCLPDKPDNKLFTALIDILDKHFTPVSAYFAHRKEFYTARQQSGESVNEWSTRLRTLAVDCGFGTELDVVLRDVFAIGLYSRNVQDRIFEEDASKSSVTFTTVLSTAMSKEAVSKLHTSEPQIKAEPMCYTKKHSQIRSNSNFKTLENNPCKVCGRKNHKSENCAYREYSCNSCKQLGHLASVCTQKKPKKKTSNTRFIQKYDSSSSDEEPFYKAESLKYHFVEDSCNNTRAESGDDQIVTVEVKIHNKTFAFEADSGSAHSFISLKFREKHFPNIEITESNVTLKDYIGRTFTPVGKVILPCEYEGTTQLLKFLVVKTTGPPLLGRINMRLLKILTLNIQPTPAAMNSVQVDQLNLPDEVKAICAKFPGVFQEGLGTFKNYEISLPLRKDAKPRFFQHRALPYALKDKVATELDRLISIGVLVPNPGSPWGTPIVPVLKSDGSIRICGDFKITVNPSLETMRYPLPKIENLLASMGGASLYTKLDLREAFQQLKIDKPSQDIMTLSTHKGQYAFTRLSYGITIAPMIFQSVLEQILCGIDGVFVFQDDMLIAAKSVVTHNEILHEVLSRLNSAGLRLRTQKCQFLRESVEYLGHYMDKNGFKPKPENVAAIKQAREPQDAKELKSFLGMVTFYLKYIPNAADILSPLHQLTRKDSKWNWTEDCSTAFNLVKRKLISPPVLTHFMPELPIYLKVDASKVAISAILSHCFPDNSEKPLAFASRVLTPAERKYPQIEKEGLALVYGVLKFHEYLYGNHKVIIWSDHKPLTVIFGEKKGIPLYSANRLQRWAHILSPYIYQLRFVSSEENAADYLSRYTEDTEAHEDFDPFQAVSYVHFLQENSLIVPDWAVLRAATAKDSILSTVYHRVLHDGWPAEEDNDGMKPYFTRRYELTVDQGCVMWGHRLVVPSASRSALLSLLHECHFGASKMKSLARNAFWWPHLDSDIERMAADCKKCQQYRSNPPKTPQKWTTPSKPWTRLHLDFFGPINNSQYLIVCDASSKWIECFHAKTTSSGVVMEHLSSLFSRFGLPKTIVSDNAPCFKSEEFQRFLTRLKILHLTGAPYHPETNGLAENAVKTIKLFMKKENLMEKQPNVVMDHLNKFLFLYRNTPHATTNETPAQLMFGRPLRTHISLMFNAEERQRTHQPKEQRLSSLKPGDQVLARDYRPRQPPWTYGKVTDKGYGTVTVTVDGGQEVKRHQDQLLLVGRHQKDRDSSAELAAQDTQLPAATSATSDSSAGSVASDRQRRRIKPPARYSP